MRLGWFSTGRDQAAIDLLLYVLERGVTPSFVFCNRGGGERKKTDRFISIVEENGIDLICFSWKKFLPELRNKDTPMWREKYDRRVLEMIPESDLIVLAGYMLIVSPLACEELKIINLHPALPDGPKGMWEEVVWDLIEKRATETGAMMHLVTKELDRGPAVTYCKFTIDYRELWEDIEGKDLAELKKNGHPLFDKIREEELKREFPLIHYTIQAVDNGEIVIRDQKVYADGRRIQGHDITQRVEEEIKKSK